MIEKHWLSEDDWKNCEFATWRLFLLLSFLKVTRRTDVPSSRKILSFIERVLLPEVDALSETKN